MAHITLNRNDAHFMSSLPAFYNKCIFFYQEPLDQILARFNFGEENNALKYCLLLSPKCVLEGYSSSVAPLALCFKDLFTDSLYNDLDREYTVLQNSKFPWMTMKNKTGKGVEKDDDDDEEDKEWDYDAFWDHVRKVKKGSGKPAFPLARRTCRLHCNFASQYCRSRTHIFHYQQQ